MLGGAFFDSHQAAGVVLLLHCGYVSAPTDFGVSWRKKSQCFEWHKYGGFGRMTVFPTFIFVCFGKLISEAGWCLMSVLPGMKNLFIGPSKRGSTNLI